MAEGFEQHQVPHQTRKDKLRVNNPSFCLDNNNAAALFPLYDPSLLSSDLIHQSFNLDEMHMIPPSSSSSSNHMYNLNPQLNPNSVQDLLNSQTLCLSLSSYPLELNLPRYASVLKGSRFLKPAQLLLEEICGAVKGISLEKDSEVVDLSAMESYPLMENLSENGKKSRLISMLDEVCKWYKQYYQQIQTVVASFESVSGLSSAAPLANMALKALSKHFTCLKNDISDQLHYVTKSKDETAYDKLEINSGRGAYAQRSLTGYNDNQPVWRPQRALPEHAVTVLKAWLFEHFLHPYPTDADKLMLATQTGLSRNQVSNWFINARVRLWKPMVEEIHMLETHHAQTEEQQTDHLPTKSSFEEFPLMRNCQHQLTETPLPYDNLLHNPHLGVCGSGSVSLTLGLHQTDVGLSESYAMNAAARRFGLETEQNGQFGGQLPHDFVW